ncbi:MAG TPA: NAD(P)-dependent oxidoreductase [Casimicrobiaceae bacterium]|nr:NAD(P)-dependent oxidoreductase [Casimicrobiaceae bacterium]
MDSLQGRTLFITGASRGVGFAIAMRAALDGANIVIAAKTTEKHPTLIGTIYSAAEEIEKAGGRALPLAVDIRDENAVRSAVEQAVAKFGGIDILVNNASAISLSGTLATPMKRFDLMFAVNVRGTFLCTQACLPHLQAAAAAGRNPHVLMLSPPLNMRPRWFKDHVAYTMAKYGMSMCVLGMAEEFRAEGIAVNALWPRTLIATAALKMVPSMGGRVDGSRKPEILANAAHAILLRDARRATGNFYIDDDVLAEAGVTDISRYEVTPGTPLIPDIFID